jgi:hypothetical protein
MFRFVALSVLCLATVLAGCSRVPSQPKPVPVALKVVFPNGEPLKAGEVRLSPDRGSGGREVEAVCRPAGDGTFKVTTFADGDGAVPGRYVVVVKGVRGLPGKYADADTSDLRATVASAGGSVEVRVEP